MAKPHNNSSRVLRDRILAIIWAQWNRLGLNGTGESNHYSVDIESALIAAAFGSRLDGRLFEGVRAWLNRYGALVNGERMATLTRDANDEWSARFLGALFEGIDPVQWKGVIKRCASSRSPSWKRTPLLIRSANKGWRDKDPIWEKWGIIADRTSPRPKMQDHNTVLRHNALMRYRALYGTIVRADVFYLLSVHHHSRTTRGWNLPTTVNLAHLLHCHPSTIHRIQKELERGGFIEPLDASRKRRSSTGAWPLRDLPLLPTEEGDDLGIVDWVGINSLLHDTFTLAAELETNPDEAIAKVSLQDFQTRNFPLLIDHGVVIPKASGVALGPLGTHSLDELVGIITKALASFVQIIGCRAISNDVIEKA